MRFLDWLANSNGVIVGSFCEFIQGNDNEFSLSDAKDVFQIVFWILAGTITILTYMRARRTILAPIRNEVFKRQLDVFSSITALFAGKREKDLQDDFDFGVMIAQSQLYLIEDYAKYALQTELKIKRELTAKDVCEFRIVNRQGISARAAVDLDELLLEVDGGSSKPSKHLAEAKAAAWHKHPVIALQIPVKYNDAKKRVVETMESPLLPKSIRTLLEKYIFELDLNVDRVYDFLSGGAAEMAKRFPTKEAFLDWQANFEIEALVNSERLVERLNPMKPLAREILNEMNSYFAVETLAKDLGSVTKM